MSHTPVSSARHSTRRPRTIEFWRGDLPHWQVEDGRYFITIHEHGAIPPTGQQRIRSIAQQLRGNIARSDNQCLRVSRLIFKEMEAWLDRTSPTAQLQDPHVAQIVCESITHRCERRIWNMHEFVIMPTHVHLFFELHEDIRLKTCLESFKRWTGHEAAKVVQLTGPRFWQTEWFDHWSRSDEEDEKIVRYIRQNPEKARLVTDYRTWPFGSWSLGS